MSSTGEHVTAAALVGTGGAGGDTGSVPATTGAAAHAGATDASTIGTSLVGNATKDNTEGDNDDVNSLLKEIHYTSTR